MKSALRITLGLALLLLAQDARSEESQIETKQAWSTSRILATTAANTACVASPWDDDTPSCAFVEVNTKGARKGWLLLYYVKDTGTEVQVYKDTSLTGGTPWFLGTLGDAITPPEVKREERYDSFDVSAASSGDTRAWNIPFEAEGPHTRFRFVVVGGSSSDVVAAYEVRAGW